MNPEKDYYRILGVLQDAEDIVIKAAYKALAQKYHPDKFQGDAKHAKNRMQEINEAYAILSDAIERKKYDSNLGKPEYEDDSTEEADDLLHTLDKDWADATEYFPDLVGIAFKLSKISKQLEYTFKVIIIEKRDFSNRYQLEQTLKEKYFLKYFGNNKKIHEFAELLFNEKRMDVLQKLNRAVNLLGSYVDPDVIIDTIVAKDFPEYKNNKKFEAVKHYALKLIQSKNLNGMDYYQDQDLLVHYAKKILEVQNIMVDKVGFFNVKYVFMIDDKEFKLSALKLIDFAIEKSRKFMS